MQAVIDNIHSQIAEHFCSTMEIVRGLYGLSNLSKAVLLKCSKNFVYAVEDPEKGVHMILRITKPGFRTKSQLQTETAWLNEIKRDSCLTVPKPIPGKNGALVQTLPLSDSSQEYYCVMFMSLRGKVPNLSGSKESILSMFSKLGETAALLHQNAILWNASCNLDRPVFDDNTVFGINSGYRQMLRPITSPELYALFNRTAAVVKSRLQKFGKGLNRFGLIHGDLNPSNLLDENGRIAIIDFDDCGYGWYLMDFAGAVSFMELNPHLSEFISAWLEGYKKIRKVTKEEVKMLPTFIVLNRFLLLRRIITFGYPEVNPRDFIGETAEITEKYLSVSSL